jgi:hypothetical protein
VAQALNDARNFDGTIPVNNAFQDNAPFCPGGSRCFGIRRHDLGEDFGRSDTLANVIDFGVAQWCGRTLPHSPDGRADHSARDLAKATFHVVGNVKVPGRIDGHAPGIRYLSLHGRAAIAAGTSIPVSDDSGQHSIRR